MTLLHIRAAALLLPCLLQACASTPPRQPLAIQPLLRIDDARNALPAAAAAPPRSAALPVQTPDATPTLPVVQSRMEIVQLGPNEFRLQYRQPATADAMVPATADSRIQIVNGNGVRGQGERVRVLLARHGIEAGRVVNQRGHYQRSTIIEYLPGQEPRAQAMLVALQGHARLLPTQALPDRLTLRLVLGRDHAARLAALDAAPTPLMVALDAAAVPHFNQE